MTTITLIHSNARRDKGFRYFIKYVPSRIDDTIKKMEEIVKGMKERKADIEANPKQYDLERKNF